MLLVVLLQRTESPFLLANEKFHLPIQRCDNFGIGGVPRFNLTVRQRLP
jgi:hypothetical protein